MRVVNRTTQNMLEQHFRGHARAVLWNSNLACRETIKFRCSLVDNVDMRASFHGLLDTQVENRLAFVWVRGNQHDMRGLLNIGDAVGHHPGSACQRVAWAREGAMMMIDMRCPDDLAQQLLEEVRFLIRSARRANAANRFCTTLISDNAQARGKHIDGLVPGGGLQLPFLANKRRAQSLRTVDELEAPASSIAQPAIIDGIIGARHQP